MRDIRVAVRVFYEIDRYATSIANSDGVLLANTTQARKLRRAERTRRRDDFLSFWQSSDSKWSFKVRGRRCTFSRGRIWKLVPSLELLGPPSGERYELFVIYNRRLEALQKRLEPGLRATG